MKKQFLILPVLMSFIFTALNAQQPVFYDATRLSQKKDVDFKKIVLDKEAQQLLANYYSINPNSINVSLLDANPFFKGMFYTEGGNDGSTNYITKALSSVGGLDVTNIADGVAKFIVNRTKQELNITFFNKFKEELSKDEYKDLQTVFPQTYKALNAISDDIYNYEAYLQTLKESFGSDMDHLPVNLPSIIENHPDFFARFPELEAALKNGCYIASQLKMNVHPGDILQNYPQDYLDQLNTNGKAAFQTLQLISASLRDTCKTCTHYWVSSNQVNSLVRDETAFKLYLGLIYQQAKTQYNPIAFRGITLVQLLDTTATFYNTTVQAYKNYIVHFAEKANNINTLIAGYTKIKNDSLAIEQYSQYYDAAIDLLQYATEAGKLVPPELIRTGKYNYFAHLSDTLSDFFDVSRSASALVLDVNRKNYASAVVNAVHIYSVVIDNHFISKTDLAAATDSVKSITKKSDITSYATAAPTEAELNQLKPAEQKHLKEYSTTLYTNHLTEAIADLYSKDVVKKFFQYGTFMATIVQAKSSDDVEAAIEAFALPAGSARIKRESKFNVALNAYCGLYGGLERQQFVYTEKTPAINSFGVTAPVGVSISWGAKRFPTTCCGKPGHNSHSIFLSVIDVGAIASFRFQNDSVQALSKIQLKDIIAPGIFYSWGIPKTPLSINIGYQLSPFLRGVSTTDNTYQGSYQRISVSFLVDIPVLNFYTRPKE